MLKTISLLGLLTVLVSSKTFDLITKEQGSKFSAEGPEKALSVENILSGSDIQCADTNENELGRILTGNTGSRLALSFHKRALETNQACGDLKSFTGDGNYHIEESGSKLSVEGNVSHLGGRHSSNTVASAKNMKLMNFSGVRRLKAHQIGSNVDLKASGGKSGLVHGARAQDENLKTFSGDRNWDVLERGSRSYSKYGLSRVGGSGYKLKKAAKSFVVLPVESSLTHGQMFKYPVSEQWLTKSNTPRIVESRYLPKEILVSGNRLPEEIQGGMMRRLVHREELE